MGITQARRKKRTTGNNKGITSELPNVKCEKLRWGSLVFEWEINRLNGSIEQQKNAIMQKINELDPKERKEAAICLLNVSGSSNTFVTAAILVIKEFGVELNLATLLVKAFKGRKYEDCISILKQAGVNVGEKTLELIGKFCDKRNELPLELYQVPI
jgi:hypothetical protein